MELLACLKGKCHNYVVIDSLVLDTAITIAFLSAVARIKTRSTL